MTRALGLIGVLAAMAIGGYLYASSGSEAVSPSGAAVVQQAAVSAAADASLVQARIGVEAFAAANGAYGGAPLPAGVTLVPVDAATYCLQVGAGEAARHLTSPGSGQAQPGPC